MKVALLKTALAFQSANEDDLSQLVILPAGVVELYEMEPILVDAEAAEIMIAAFNDQGVKVPIDFEHSAVMKAERGEPSPAAAWISGLSWNEQKGLIADVEEWTQEAYEMVLSGRYKYLSPYVIVETCERRPLILHSVALTNKPRIKNQEELLHIAASSSFTLGGIINKENMMTTKKSPPVWVQKVKKGNLQRVLMQAEEEPIAGVPVEDGIVDEAAAAEVDDRINALKELVVSQGVEIAEDAIAVDILDAVGNFIMGLIETVGAAEDAPPVEDVAAEVAVASVNNPPARLVPPAPPGSSAALETELCDQLGIARGTSRAEIVASIQGLRGHIGHVSVAKYNALATRLGTIEESRAKAQLEVVIGSLIEQQKLNPHDAEQMKWARNFAVMDHDGFLAIMARAPQVIPTGRVVSPAVPATDAGRSEREMVIASAVELYNSDSRVTGMSSKAAFVNVSLSEVSQASLTEAELVKIC